MTATLSGKSVSVSVSMSRDPGNANNQAHLSRRRRKKKRSMKRENEYNYDYEWRCKCCGIHAMTITCTALLMNLSYLLGFCVTAYGRVPIYCQDEGQGSVNVGNTSLHGAMGMRITDSGGAKGEDELEMIDRIVKDRIEAVMKARELQERVNTNTEESPTANIFPPTVSSYANAMVRVAQSQFLTEFDYGTPTDFLSRPGIEEAVIMYNTESAMPKSSPHSNTNADRNTSRWKRMMESLPVHDATENCDEMNVIYQNPKIMSGQCLAIVGNYESYHVQKWMKRSSSSSSEKKKLQIVGRTAKEKRPDDFHVPPKKKMKRHQRMLQVFFSSEGRIKAELQPILDRISIQNTIIVMTANAGHLDLLANFVCAARAKEMDISNLLVFATDPTTHDFVKKGLGVEAFYDRENFGSLPTEEAQRYGDKTFTDMMYAKVLSVLLVNSLGYDVLFQDVDIVWYKHPLSIFHNDGFINDDRDIIFQDDGSRSARFSPSSANSGFYYVRNNDRTRYLFTSLLYSSNLIFQSGSHQQVLIALINEHSSRYGLTIKILNQEDFPCGAFYHRNASFMKRIAQGHFTPYLFHMSWTRNKVDKIRYLEQMGLWYFNRTTSSLSMDKLPVEKLCLLEPVTKCHYKDKPSVIPCKDSPSIDPNGESFW